MCTGYFWEMSSVKPSRRFRSTFPEKETVKAIPINIPGAYMHFEISKATPCL